MTQPRTLAAIATWRPTAAPLQPSALPPEELGITLAAHRTNASALVALYDAFQGAAAAMEVVENQTRADDVADFLLDEICRLKHCAHLVGAHLAAMSQVSESDAEARAQRLFDCALDMGFELNGAMKVLAEAAKTPRTISYVQ